MNNDALEYFGKMLMLGVRDETITSWDMIVNGKMKGITAETVRDKIKDFSDEQIEILMWLIPKITDNCLHNLLVTFEQNDEVKVLISNEAGSNDIKQISDGLEGELYTEDGWIKRFSKERYEEL